MSDIPLVLWLNDIKPEHRNLVGGKAINLAKLYQELTGQGIRVPDGFVVTTEAWRLFIAHNPDLRKKILDDFDHIDFEESDESTLHIYSTRIWNTMDDAEIPIEVHGIIVEAYRLLEKGFWPDVDTAVRSSAVAEDLDDASFAGEHDSYLNIRGPREITKHVELCFGSLFTERAIFYRYTKNFPLFPEEGIAVVVQKMVRSDRACSGVAFSQEPVSLAPYLVRIEASWGLGEYVVRGLVTPDVFLIGKPLSEHLPSILIGKELGNKGQKLVYHHRTVEPTRGVTTPKREQESFCLSDEEALYLGEACHSIQQHYRRPMDVEWAKDGVGGGRAEDGDGTIYIVQARATTFKKDPLIIERTHLKGEGEILATGISGCPGAGQGKTEIIATAFDLGEFEKGGVLVTEMTDPDWVPIMRKASAIITDRGGKNCHAVIVARELGIPCVVGTGDATKTLDGVEFVTIDGGFGGEKGYGIRGLVPLETSRIDLRPSIEFKKGIQTKIMLILADPFTAPMYSFYPNDGIGLARLEFIITNIIKMHPCLALHASPKEILESEERLKFRDLICGYENAQHFFISKLTQGIMQLALAVWPNPIIVRLSDFKTNEYVQLLGGRAYEPSEENPMLGWRGASRYYDPRYRDAFQLLECAALRVAREKGFTNIKAMIPFVRTIREAKETIILMEDAGLKQGKDGFEIYCMTELPANVMCLEELAEIFDGFSIGSNDLTQLTLGLDRDSGELAHIADERDGAVRAMIQMAIEKAQKCGKPIGICGQAPSNYPEYVTWLVEQGITSISVQPDAITQTIENVYQAEREKQQTKLFE